jgi:hypothetical protein
MAAFMVFLLLGTLGRELFAQLEGIPRVLMSLPGQFMSSEMISFAVGGCSGGVAVGGEVMEFRDSIVCALGHCAPPVWLDAQATAHPTCSS